MTLRYQDLDFENTSDFQPEPALFRYFQDTAHGHHFDRILNRATLSSGQAGFPIGRFDLPKSGIGQYREANIYDFVFKKPNDSIHRIPRPLDCLSPVFQASANLQFANSMYAKSKIGIASFRMHPVSAGDELRGSTLHVHRYPIVPPDEGNIHYMKQDMSDETLRILESADPNMMPSETFIANTAPTIVQRKEIRQKEAPKTGYDHYYYKELTPSFRLQAIQPNQLVAGTGTYHCAPKTATAENLTPNCSVRIFLTIAYLHTKNSAQDYMNSVCPA